MKLHCKRQQAVCVSFPQCHMQPCSMVALHGTSGDYSGSQDQSLLPVMSQREEKRQNFTAPDAPLQPVRSLQHAPGISVSVTPARFFVCPGSRLWCLGKKIRGKGIGHHGGLCLKFVLSFHWRQKVVVISEHHMNAAEAWWALVLCARRQCPLWQLLALSDISWDLGSLPADHLSPTAQVPITSGLHHLFHSYLKE